MSLDGGLLGSDTHSLVVGVGAAFPQSKRFRPFHRMQEKENAACGLLKKYKSIFVLWTANGPI